MIEIVDLSVSYGRHVALEGVTFSIDRGVITVVLGSNGAGKTTLINAIAGSVPIVQGIVRFDGRDITNEPAHKRVKMRMATVPQGRGLFPDMSVQDNLALGAFVVESKDEIAERLQSVFDLFPRLAERRDQAAETMSGGEQQMLAIGRALMSSPAYLLLDEPSLGLSPVLTLELFRTISKISERGVGVLLVEQNALQSLKIAEQAILIENGRIVDKAPAAALRYDPRIIESYLGGRETSANADGIVSTANDKSARSQGSGSAPASVSSPATSSSASHSGQRTMLAARLYKVGEPMVLEQIPLPEPDSTEVRVRVKACNIVPNLANVLKMWTTWFPQLPLPRLPAIFGLDPAGVVDSVGSRVHNFKPGDRVYVNPGRYCGSCEPCRNGDLINCRSYAFCGYFGFSEGAKRVLDENPYGGLAEYMLAPQYSLVKIPDNLSFEAAARFGYLGTAYSAMRKVGVRAGSSMLVNGISGTLGIGCALFGLGMGATRILGTARNWPLLERVKALSPRRIEIFQMDAGRPIDDWVRELTDGEGVDLIPSIWKASSPRTSVRYATPRAPTRRTN
jgi:ABC-type branched-subunit amino acid transport system ATPase component/D-arabinose 1-dehydrogenase-like Zn-dependent alcohol dehydrogenase